MIIDNRSTVISIALNVIFCTNIEKDLEGMEIMRTFVALNFLSNG